MTPICIRIASILARHRASAPTGRVHGAISTVAATPLPLEAFSWDRSIPRPQIELCYRGNRASRVRGAMGDVASSGATSQSMGRHGAGLAHWPPKDQAGTRSGWRADGNPQRSEADGPCGHSRRMVRGRGSCRRSRVNPVCRAFRSGNSPRRSMAHPRSACLPIQTWERSLPACQFSQYSRIQFTLGAEHSCRQA